VIAPVPPDTEHSTAKLVRALRAVPSPGAVPESMIARAERGYYHDYLSPLALPEMALAEELAAMIRHPSRAGLPSRRAIQAIRAGVLNGEFDASKAESDAWAASPEGQAAFASLLRRPK
jgi:hypothetical protein